MNAVVKMLVAESAGMRFLRRLRLNSLAWSCRRLHCPVDKQALVLEVGSGGNPYFRANVLLDAYQETRERHWEKLVTDRPTVLGFVENLPFKDKAFDFVIAAHVLEHSMDPDTFLRELQRVAKAGYIEVPHAFMERVNPYLDHRLEIHVEDNRLVIRKKSGWQHDREVVELYEQQAKVVISRFSIPKFPFEFHVRFYWQGHIDYKILNPETDARWASPAGSRQPIQQPGRAWSFRQLALSTIRSLMSQSGRNRRLDLFALLRCPGCKHAEANLVKMSEQSIQCSHCNSVFETIDGMPNFSTVGP